MGRHRRQTVDMLGSRRRQTVDAKVTFSTAWQRWLQNFNVQGGAL